MLTLFLGWRRRTLHVSLPGCIRGSNRRLENIAAIIAEPILSAGGMLFPPPGYLHRLKEITSRNGALLIIDEAQTGFGRTGKWFAIEHHGVEPDILTLSKSIGNGFAVAAVITTAEIADKVVSDGLWNLSSHQSDPGCR